MTCVNVGSTTAMTQKRIWSQVRVPASLYAMNLGSLTSAANRLSRPTAVNWNQMSDRVLPAQQKVIVPTHGNSLHKTLTSDRPGAASPGGAGVDVKHDSYARYLNRKKAATLNTQTKKNVKVPVAGNKTKAVGLLSDSMYCCS